jgi:hypothetical protein
LGDDLIYRFEEVVIDLLFPEVHAALGVVAVERGSAQMCVGDVNEVHLYFCVEFYGIYEGWGWSESSATPGIRIN